MQRHCSLLRTPPPLWGRSARALCARAGRGVSGPRNQTNTPLPTPPPQGGREAIAALHAQAANPELDVTVATKGLLGKCGCTRMVQGGYNVALHPGDSVERHFMDTIEGGKW